MNIALLLDYEKKKGLGFSMKYDTKYYKTQVKTKKGKQTTFLYKKFWCMKERCYRKKHKSYEYYGGRGIKVEDWLLNFHNYVNHLIDILPKGAIIEDMQKFKWSIDRIDNDGNYERGNLRWGSPRMQNLNQRKRSDNTSGYKGVSWDKNRRKWFSRMVIKKKNIFLGCFNTREEAFAVYLEAVKKYQGQEAYEHVLSLHPHWEAA